MLENNSFCLVGFLYESERRALTNYRRSQKKNRWKVSKERVVSPKDLKSIFSVGVDRAAVFVLYKFDSSLAIIF